MKCPTCKTAGAYEGYLFVECPNPRCMHFKEGLRPAPIFKLRLYKEATTTGIVEADFPGYEPCPFTFEEITKVERFTFGWFNAGQIEQPIEAFGVESPAGENVYMEGLWGANLKAMPETPLLLEINSGLLAGFVRERLDSDETMV